MAVALRGGLVCHSPQLHPRLISTPHAWLSSDRHYFRRLRCAPPANVLATGRVTSPDDSSVSVAGEPLPDNSTHGATHALDAMETIVVLPEAIQGLSGQTLLISSLQPATSRPTSPQAATAPEEDSWQAVVNKVQTEKQDRRGSVLSSFEESFEGSESETESEPQPVSRRQSPEFVPESSPDSSLEEATPPSQLDNITAAVCALDDTPAHPVKATPAPIKLKAALACVGVGLAVRFLIPMPQGVLPQAWTLLAVFCTTIAGLVLEPMPVSAWSLCCVTTLVATKACTFQTAMSGLTNDAIWLIVFAFFFAKAFEKTGLGERIANIFVSAVGQSTLGLAYSLAIAETLMAPAMPSCTARAGGIFMPVIKFLAKAGKSEPRRGRKKMGAFLVHSQMQVSSNIAALFMTGAAQNLLAVNIARSMGVHIPDVWTTWAWGACVPGLVSVIMIPLIMYRLTPPETRSTPSAPGEARQRLAAMGPLKTAETVTLVTLAGAVVLWMLGEQLGCSAVLTAMIALSSLLVAGVLTWKDCLEYTPAWDTLLWFSVLMSMCSALASCGLVARMADAVGMALAAAQLPWLASFGLLHGVFFWCHYIFASQVGHVGALYGAFLAMMIAAGAPVTLSALTLGYSANLFGSLTHYASGPAAVYHGSGYTRLSEVMKAGALMAVRSWLVWGTVGMAWWKIIGWW